MHAVVHTTARKWFGTRCTKENRSIRNEGMMEYVIPYLWAFMPCLHTASIRVPGRRAPIKLAVTLLVTAQASHYPSFEN